MRCLGLAVVFCLAISTYTLAAPQASAQAEVVEIAVLDVTTREPLGGVAVNLAEPADHCITNAAGACDLQVPQEGRVTITVSAPGYVPQTVVLTLAGSAEGETLTFALEQEKQQQPRVPEASYAEGITEGPGSGDWVPVSSDSVADATLSGVTLPVLRGEGKIRLSFSLPGLLRRDLEAGEGPGTILSIPNGLFSLEAGKPVIPAMTGKFVLPPGASIMSVTATADETVELEGLEPALHIPVRITPVGPVQEDIVVEELTSTYPAEFYRVSEVGALRDGNTLGTVSIWPVQFDPTTGSALVHASLELEVVYSVPGLVEEERSVSLLDDLPDRLAEIEVLPRGHRSGRDPQNLGTTESQCASVIPGAFLVQEDGRSECSMISAGFWRDEPSAQSSNFLGVMTYSDAEGSAFAQAKQVQHLSDYGEVELVTGYDRVLEIIKQQWSDSPGLVLFGAPSGTGGELSPLASYVNWPLIGVIDDSDLQTVQELSSDLGVSTVILSGEIPSSISSWLAESGLRLIRLDDQKQINQFLHAQMVSSGFYETLPSPEAKVYEREIINQDFLSSYSSAQTGDGLLGDSYWYLVVYDATAEAEFTTAAVQLATYRSAALFEAGYWGADAIRTEINNSYDPVYIALYGDGDPQAVGGFYVADPENDPVHEPPFIATDFYYEVRESLSVGDLTDGWTIDSYVGRPIGTNDAEAQEYIDTLKRYEHGCLASWPLDWTISASVTWDDDEEQTAIDVRDYLNTEAPNGRLLLKPDSSLWSQADDEFTKPNYVNDSWGLDTGVAVGFAKAHGNDECIGLGSGEDADWLCHDELKAHETTWRDWPFLQFSDSCMTARFMGAWDAYDFDNSKNLGCGFIDGEAIGYVGTTAAALVGHIDGMVTAFFEDRITDFDYAQGEALAWARESWYDAQYVHTDWHDKTVWEMMLIGDPSVDVQLGSADQPSGGLPDTPTLEAPTNGSTTCDSTPYFNWSDSTEAFSYHILVDDDSDFSSPVIDASTPSSNYTPGSDLPPDTYYWKVADANYCGESAWTSPSWNVTVSAAPSSAPTLSLPGNGSSTCDSTPYFNWSDVTGATSYRIQVDDSATFTSPAIDQTTSFSNYTPSAGLAPDTYYWRVQGYNSCGDGPWSSPTWSFTVNAVPSSAPTLSAPGNGSSTCDSTPYFNWSDVTGATSYRIQVDDSSTFTSPVINQTTSVSNYTPSAGLAPDTYYWRVQGYNSCGDGPWSSPTWSFTVNAAPSSAPSLSQPGNGSSTCDSTPFFDWSDVSGATSYRIQVDDSSTFTSPVINQTTSVSNYTPSAGLAPDTYYWRVQGYNSCGDGPWSSPTWSFTVNAAPSSAPTLSDPGNGSGTCDDTPFFDWSDVTGATSYRIQVDDSSTFTSPVVDQTTSVSYYTPSAGLAPDTYYWHVQGYNSCGDGPWSSPTWTFTVNSQAPTSAPTLYDPTNGTGTCDSTPAFDWSNVSDATSYRIQVDDSSTFTSPVINQTTSVSDYTPSAGLAPDTYYWRVQGYNSCGDGPWSSPTWSFTVNTPVPSSAPTLYDPTNGSGTCDPTPAFDWSDVSGATSYRIQVDDSSTFTSPVINQTTSVSNYTPSGGLAPDTYYWRVQGYNSCGDGPWSSPTWSFTVNSQAPTLAPTLYDPTNGTGTCDSTPAFDWSNVSGATSYRIHVDDSSTFTSPVINQTTSVSDYTPSAGLAPDTYYWRVQASNGCGDGPWSSPTWSFTVNTPAPSAAPSLYQPTNGSDTCDPTPYFDWSNVTSATYYRIQVDNDSGFGSPTIDATPSASYYTPPADLSSGGYYWRVQGVNACGGGPWSSPTWSFSVNQAAPSSAPTLSSPPDTSTTSDDTPSFDWSDVTGASSYRIEVDDDPGFGSPVIDASPPGSSYTPSSPLADDTYYWHVQASNGCGDGPWSSAWSFTVDTSTPVVGPVVYDSYTADDDDTGDSSGNDNGVVDCGETIELFVILANEGTDAATGVSATISESDPYVALVSNTSSGYPDIPGGSTGTNSDDYEFTVDLATPDAHVIHFDLDITGSNGGPWTDSFDVTVSCGNNAPALSWTGETNYVSDGLHPESGGSTDDYEYRIEYSDPDGDAPSYVRVHIREGGIDISGSPFTMACASGDYTTGVFCSYTKSGLDEGADYSYYFDAEDDQGNPATPTPELDAPYVSDSGLPKWTFLVYLNGDNPTEGAAIDDFLEMSNIGSTSAVNIVVWLDRAGGYDDRYGDWDDTYKFYLTEDMTPDPANGVYLGEKDMSDPQTLVDFVQTEMANYPAEHYALIVWDRGSETRRDIPEDTLFEYVCWDNDPYAGMAMTMPELQTALSTITNDGADPLDLLGFDASLMALTEIDNQLIPYADVRVSSQGTEPSDGWFYDEVLLWLTAIPEMTPSEFAYQIVDWYCLNYGNDPTMSATDLQTPYSDLNVAVDDLAAALVAGVATNYADIATARANTQKFPNPDYVDLYDFAYRLNAHVSDAAINTAATAVMGAVDNAIVNECGSNTWPDAHGISVYFPASETNYDATYDGDQDWLAFTAGHLWDEWLHAFYQGLGDAFEPDDSSGEATVIESEVPQTHSIVPVGDEDWVTFTLYEESEVIIETSGPSGDTRMWLYNSSEQEIEYDDDDGVGLFSRIDRLCSQDALGPGTYYVKVDEFGDNNEIESYDLTITVGPCQFYVYVPLVVRDYRPPEWTILVSEDFEAGFPHAGWEVSDQYSGDGKEYYWAADDFLPYRGDWSTWPAAGGADSVDPSANDYPSDCYSWMVYGPFDLSDASEAEVSFHYWNRSELTDDYLLYAAATDGIHFWGTKMSGDSGGWRYRNFDLTNVPTLGDLTGQSQVWLAFVFRSDSDTNVFQGAFLDDVTLRKAVGLGGAPSSLAEESVSSAVPDTLQIETGVMELRYPESIWKASDGTPTPTATCTCTPTPTPSMLPTPTPTITSTVVITPTATACPTPVSTMTATPTSTVTQEGTPSVQPDSIPADVLVPEPSPCPTPQGT